MVRRERSAIRREGIGADGRAHRRGRGAGVAAELLPHLFDRFYRGPAAAARSRPGVGLGLAVVRGLVDAMEGTAVAAPSELGGLAITIRVPAATQTDNGSA